VGTDNYLAARVNQNHIGAPGLRSTANATLAAEWTPCPECGRRFTTQESVILMVAKRSGVTEPFTRDKIVRGVQRACQGRPVDEDQLAMLAQRVEETIRARGLAEVPSHEVGLAILGPLRDVDEVAYLRFASVYRGWESLDDFEKEMRAILPEGTSTLKDPAGKWQTIRYALDSNARMIRFCVIWIVLVGAPILAATAAPLPHILSKF
jgi:transcriptional repressor NrdR